MSSLCEINFLIFSPYKDEAKFTPKNKENNQKLSRLPQNKKIRPLYFLELLKLKKVKRSYFFSLRQSRPLFDHFMTF